MHARLRVASHDSRPSLRSRSQARLRWAEYIHQSDRYLNEESSARHPACTVTSTPAAGGICLPVDQLADWIRTKGGYIHPALTMADPAPCGARGVVFDSAVTGSDSEGLALGALIVIPTALHMNGRHACSLFDRLRSDSGASCLSNFNHIQQVAAALAYETSLGAGSEWAPYLQTLPEEPPVPWLLQEQQLASSLESLGGSTEGWAAAVAEEQAWHQDLAAELVAEYGPSLGLTQERLMWAMAQVRSRCLGSGNSAGMLPFIDLINHSSEARPPMLQLDDDDQLVMTVAHLAGNQLASAAAGDELYISYGSDFTPLEAYLKFGWVPQELWAQ